MTKDFRPPPKPLDIPATPAEPDVRLNRREFTDSEISWLMYSLGQLTGVMHERKQYSHVEGLIELANKVANAK